MPPRQRQSQRQAARNTAAGTAPSTARSPPPPARASRTRHQQKTARPNTRGSKRQNVSVVLNKRKGEEEGGNQLREDITDLSGSRNTRSKAARPAAAAAAKKDKLRPQATTKAKDRRDHEGDIDMDKENQIESKQQETGKGGEKEKGKEEAQHMETTEDDTSEKDGKDLDIQTSAATPGTENDHTAAIKQDDDHDHDDYNDNNDNDDNVNDKKDKSDDDDDDDDDDEDDWEDAMVPQPNLSPNGGEAGGAAPSEPANEHRDLELTIDKGHTYAFTDTPSGKKGPSKIEREIRIDTHCLHVQFLLAHNTIRNAWIDDREVQASLREQLPKAIQEEVRSWEVAARLKSSSRHDSSQSNKKGKKRQQPRKGSRREGEEVDADTAATAQENTVDPTIHVLQVLAAFWKNKFRVTAPGLRKHGYRSVTAAQNIVSAFEKANSTPSPSSSSAPQSPGAHSDDAISFGEKIRDRGEFRELARKMEGSRDVGAQLFTALLRAIGLEARMVASLQPLGFAWTKAEECDIDNNEEQKETEGNPGASSAGHDAHNNEDQEAEESEEDSESSSTTPKSRKPVQSSKKVIDSDLPFPIYWTEVISPVTTNVIPVDAMIVPRPVATTPELLSQFEPRGAKAARAKQVIAYVVAYSSDGSAKDVTTRYLKRHMYPGKTKSFRIPAENVPMATVDGTVKHLTVDWFKIIMRRYARPHAQRTAIDRREDESELVPKQPERKVVKKDVDTLSSLRASREFVLPRFLKREEALRPGAKPVRTFTAGKGAKATEEQVYKRDDVLHCSTTEAWHKEGRRIKVGEKPLKVVPVRAMTLTRKREVELTERETGKKATQGLYARRQTERIIPPPIANGVIPKNAYGNIDCFTPWMVPSGAAHIPLHGSKRVCRKLDIDFAEAVVGFEFGNKVAAPVISGVVVASEHAGAVRAGWHEEEARRIERERLKQSRLILTTWRKLIMGVRIAERIREEYNDDNLPEESNPFVNRRVSAASGPALASPATASAPQRLPGTEAENAVGGGFDDDDDEGGGGGFLLPGEEEEHAAGGDVSGGGGGFVTTEDEAQEVDDDVIMASAQQDDPIDVEDEDDDNLSSAQDVVSISS